MLANPSGEGFNTSGVPIKPLFSESSKSPSRESFVLRFCSSSHRARVVGWLRVMALCSIAVGISSIGCRNGLATAPSEFVTCIGDACGVGAASPIILVKCPELSLCHMQWFGSAMLWQSGGSGNTVTLSSSGVSYPVQGTRASGM